MKQLILFFFGFMLTLSCNREPSIEFPYILEIPDQLDDSQLYPLVICFHGGGGRGNNNKGKGSIAYSTLKERINIEKYKAFLFMPQCPKDDYWVDTPWRKGNYSIEDVEISNILLWVNNKIESIISEYPIDPNRIYVTGQAIGGYATWDLISRFPDKFACAIPICGAGDTAVAEKIKDIPIWMFHGEDDNAVKVRYARELYNSLQKVNANIKYTELKNTAHEAWSPAWEKDTLINWMYEQELPAKKWYGKWFDK